MIVKICGITNLEDAELVLEAGADALGFIFASSKRQIDVETAADIIRRLPASAPAVGVFVDESVAQIRAIAREAGLSWIQLHGNESPDDCARLSESYKVIKAVKVDPEGNVCSGTRFPVWKLLLDTYVSGKSGGSGVPFNWESLAGFRPEDVLVAGGVTPENVRDLATRYHPFGIDVGSGVEAYPGKKDPVKLQRLFAQIRA